MEITTKNLEFGTTLVNESHFNEIKGVLSKFGLTPNQCKVFFFLGKFGSKTAAEVSKKLEIPRTETYHLLSVLQSKGLVTATFQHPIKFSSAPINKAILSLLNAETARLNALKKEEDTLKQLWEKIPTVSDEPTSATEERFQVLRGSNQINSKLIEMVSNVKNEFLILGCEQDFIKFYHANFLEVLQNKSVDYKLLTSASEQAGYIFEDLEPSNIRKLSSSVKENLCFLIKDNSEVLFYIKNASNNNKEVVAIWADSESIIYSKLLLFKNLWTKSKQFFSKQIELNC